MWRLYNGSGTCRYALWIRSDPVNVGYKVQTRLMLILIQVFKQCWVGVGECTKFVPVIMWFLGFITVFQINSKNLYWYITIVLKISKLFKKPPVKPPVFYNENWQLSFGNNMKWWFLDSEMLKEPELWLITESNTCPRLVSTLPRTQKLTSNLCSTCTTSMMIICRCYKTMCHWQHKISKPLHDAWVTKIQIDCWAPFDQLLPIENWCSTVSQV